MSESLDPLKVTTKVMHRIWFELADTKTWYSVMKEANTWFGKEWKAQPRVKKKLEFNWENKSHKVWFDVPDIAFASWVSVKLAVTASTSPNK
jgi:hypothetical protein